MKEIKFRGKRVDNGEWAKGYFVGDYDGNHYITQPLVNSHRLIRVIPETVGQFTGLKDAYGTEIYEGDIVKLCETNPVLFQAECMLCKYGYQFIFRDLDNGRISGEYFIDKCEVVGNIHAEVSDEKI